MTLQFGSVLIEEEYYGIYYGVKQTSVGVYRVTAFDRFYIGEIVQQETDDKKNWRYRFGGTLAGPWVTTQAEAAEMLDRLMM